MTAEKDNVQNYWIPCALVSLALCIASFFLPWTVNEGFSIFEVDIPYLKPVLVFAGLSALLLAIGVFCERKAIIRAFAVAFSASAVVIVVLFLVELSASNLGIGIWLLVLFAFVLCFSCFKATAPKQAPKPTDVRRLCMSALFVALVIIMALTPLGYMRVGALSISFLMLPVVLGSILLGPWTGAMLGFIFGITSFAQCFGIDPFGTALASINPFYTAILCFIPRILAGLLPGYIFKAINSSNRGKIIAYPIASLSGALLNTILFVGALMLLFGNCDYIKDFGNSVWAIVWLLVGINGIVEAVVCCIAGGAIAKVLDMFVFKRGRRSTVKTEASQTDSEANSNEDI